MRVATASFIALICFPGCAMAQAECLASLNVDQNKSVTFLSFGDTSSTDVASTMNCVDAENLRTQMFISGDAIDPNLIGDESQLRAKIDQLRADLASTKDALAKATSRSERVAILKGLGATAAAAATVTAAAGCFTTGTTCAGALGGVVTIVGIISSMSDDAGDFADKARVSLDRIDQIAEALDNIESSLDQNLSSQSKLKYNTVFNSLCDAIRKQCMN
ncbi:hypothetical protein NKH53_30515 [Mesorhizobium australicum]|uniref:hypothetical protein n=1 Tax=Mesorhizobium australicum TaxID=536018 RepID=UPI003339D61B